MIEPVNWNTEKDHMYKELSEQEYNALSKIIDYASYDYKDNIFALALHYLLTSRYSNAKENVDDILLLYKLRFDLCNAVKDQSIMEAIIKFVTKEISEIIAEKHREGGNQLKEFMNKAKLLLNNTSDFIILVDMISQNLDQTTQKSIYTQLELGE